MVAKRNEGIDLLRVICMFLVVLGHVLVFCSGQYQANLQVINSGNLPFNLDNSLLVFLECVCYVAVNVYFLLSGFFKINFKKERFANLLLQVVFWNTLSILCSLLLIRGGVQEAVKCLVYPFYKYWFMLVYLTIYLLSPLLNRIIEKVNASALVSCCIVFFFIFCIYSYAIDVFGVGNGTSVLWGIYCYFVGSVISKIHTSRSKSIIICLGSLTFFVGISLMFLHIGNMKMLWRFMINDTNPFLLIFAISLIALFQNIKLNVVLKIVTRISPYMLGVYLIHSSQFGNYLWFYNDLPQICSTGVLPRMIGIILYAFLVFVICTVVEYLRVRMLGNTFATLTKVFVRFIYPVC